MLSDNQRLTRYFSTWKTIILGLARELPFVTQPWNLDFDQDYSWSLS